MDEPTTTPADAVVDDAILPDEEVAQSQPDDAEAAQQPQEQTNTAEAQDEPSTDENLEWLKNKGIDPTAPDAMAKLAEQYRNAEKKMHESTAKASELQKELTSPQQAAVDNPNDALAAEVQSLKMAYAVKDFFDSNPGAKELEAKMANIVTERQEIGQLVRAGYLSMTDLYNLARGGDPSLVQEAKSQGGKEALEQLAKKQKAKAIPGSATKSEFSDNSPEDAFLKAFEAN